MSTFAPLATPPAPTDTPALMVADGRSARVHHSTTTSTVLIAFRSKQADLPAAATAATQQAAWDVAGAKAVSARVLHDNTAAVTFDTTLTREQASQISAAAAKLAAVKYAEPSVTFYPDSGGSGYYWNVDQINASAAWGKLPARGAGVVVAVIDTGIADNPQLPKALLVNTINGKTSGTKISGTTWPGRKVTIDYTASGSKVVPSPTSAPADARGLWSITLSPNADNGSTLTASMTDSSGNRTTTNGIPVDSAVDDLTVNPTNGSHFSGTVEASSKVSLRTEDSSGAITWQQAATVSGSTWTILTPTKTDFKHGDSVIVTATDEQGNAKSVSFKIDKVSHLTLDAAVSNGTISGTAEAGSTISVTDQEGTQLCPGLVGNSSDGGFSCDLNSPVDGSTVTVMATDLAGNDSEPLGVGIDTQDPVITVRPSNGTVLAGTVTDDSFPVTITVHLPNDVTRTTKVSQAGDWEITDLPALGDGDLVTVTATDNAGNHATPESIFIDKTPPAVPVVEYTDGEHVKGTGETGARVTLCYSAKKDVCETTVPGTIKVVDGQWVFTFDPKLPDRTWVKVTLTDDAGNSSASSKQVHYGKPSTPLVFKSDGQVIEVCGVAADDTPSLIDDSGPIAADPQPDPENADCWTLTPATPLADTAVVYVIVTDSNGTPSDSVRVVIDTTAPDAPVITAADTTSISGTGEPTATIKVTYTDAEGASASAETTVDGEGNWSTGLEPDAGVTATITVTQTDAVGHTSPAASVTLVEPTPSPSPSPSDPVDPATDSTGSGTAATGPSVTANTIGSGTVLPGYDFVTEARSPVWVNGVRKNEDGDGNGRDSDPTDLATTITARDGSGQLVYSKTSSHGTHVAGIVAAQGVGPATGVAPGVSILPVRVIPNSGGGDMSDVASGIRWAVGEPVPGANNATVTNPYPADVVNLSLGGYGPCSQELQGAIDVANRRRVPVVVSAGNNNDSIANYAPANCSGVIVVTATTAAKTRATYSNWGTPSTSAALLIAAPGGSGDPANCYAWHVDPRNGTACTGMVVSTIKGQLQPMSGTSMAAPQVAGTAALLKSLSKGLKPTQIANYLRSKATPMADSCPTGTCGSGIVNAAEAVSAAKAWVGTNSGPAPVVSVPTYPSANHSVSWPKTSRVGQKVSVTNAATNYGATYQWFRQWSSKGKKVNQAIKGATASSYTITRSDYGKYVWVKVTHLNRTASSSPRSRSKIATGNLRVRQAAWISGTPTVGQRLTAHKPVWSDSVSSTKYQWYRNGKKISKATKSTYKLTKADRGKKITVKVSVKSSRYYSTSTKSAATALVQ